MLRICRQCAAQYDGAPASTLCPVCVAESRKTTLRFRICRTCGRSFPGGPRAWYCPDCRAKRKLEQQRQARQRAAAGKTRKIGSEDICVICGKSYIVSSGNQRYCPGCAADAIREIDRAQARQWQADNTTPQERRELRQAHTAPLTCKVCGKEFAPRDASLTCSPECSRKLSKQSQASFEQSNREQRNQYHKDRLAAKQAAMTPIELAAYRAELNRRARENYRHRKEKEKE